MQSCSWMHGERREWTVVYSERRKRNEAVQQEIAFYVLSRALTEHTIQRIQPHPLPATTSVFAFVLFSFSSAEQCDFIVTFALLGLGKKRQRVHLVYRAVYHPAGIKSGSQPQSSYHSSLSGLTVADNTSPCLRVTHCRNLRARSVFFFALAFRQCTAQPISISRHITTHFATLQLLQQTLHLQDH